MFINILYAACIRFIFIHYLRLFQLHLIKFLLKPFALLLTLFLALKTFSGVIGVVILGLPLLLFAIKHLQVFLELAHDI